MSHTLNVGKFTIYHNGDFSGDVTFINRDEVVANSVDVPMEVLRAIVAAEIRSKAISFYESASDEAVLSKVTDF